MRRHGERQASRCRTSRTTPRRRASSGSARISLHCAGEKPPPLVCFFRRLADELFPISLSIPSTSTWRANRLCLLTVSLCRASRVSNERTVGREERSKPGGRSVLPHSCMTKESRMWPWRMVPPCNPRHSEVLLLSSRGVAIVVYSLFFDLTKARIYKTKPVFLSSVFIRQNQWLRGF